MALQGRRRGDGVPGRRGEAGVRRRSGRRRRRRASLGRAPEVDYEADYESPAARGLRLRVRLARRLSPQLRRRRPPLHRRAAEEPAEDPAVGPAGRRALIDRGDEARQARCVRHGDGRFSRVELGPVGRLAGPVHGPPRVRRVHAPGQRGRHGHGVLGRPPPRRPRPAGPRAPGRPRRPRWLPRREARVQRRKDPRRVRLPRQRRALLGRPRAPRRLPGQGNQKGPPKTKGRIRRLGRLGRRRGR
mmetsp:Transcript_1862/g.6777  ORF Transcript_1862/g.6777 Transcript_1862/m.6777 type:complete len:245 (-) Transcript_1862:124-858(-)